MSYRHLWLLIKVVVVHARAALLPATPLLPRLLLVLWLTGILHAAPTAILSILTN